MKRNSLLLLATITLLSSCASIMGKPRVYIMQNPETMEFKNCDVGTIGLDKHFKDNEECMENLKKEGWIVWGQS